MATGSGKGLQKQRDSFYCSYSAADPTGSVLSSGREALSNLSPWSHDHTKPSPLAEGDAATAAPRQFPSLGTDASPGGGSSGRVTPPTGCPASHTPQNRRWLPPAPGTAPRARGPKGASARGTRDGPSTGVLSCWGSLSPSAHLPFTRETR